MRKSLLIALVVLAGCGKAPENPPQGEASAASASSAPAGGIRVSLPKTALSLRLAETIGEESSKLAGLAGGDPGKFAERVICRPRPGSGHCSGKPGDWVCDFDWDCNYEPDCKPKQPC